MRVSPHTSQEAIEQAITEEWQPLVQFQKKFPSILDSNEIYWMKQVRLLADLSDGGDTQPMPEEPEAATGLGVIRYHKTQIVPPIIYIRSHTLDDLAWAAKDTPPKTEFLVTWVIKFGLQVTERPAPENAPVDAICGQAAIELGPELKSWTKCVDQRGGVITVHCSSHDADVAHASIHFGNQEWVGKVNNTYTDLHLIREAQVQLEIEGQWKVRPSLVIDKVRTLEAEKIGDGQVCPPLPIDAEVTINYRGSTRKVQLKAGADAWTQS
jgi:hypothetical protein